MSGPYGFRCVNDNGVLNVSDDSQAYVYLGKYGPFGADGVTDYTVDVTCVGFPLVFFSVPYNFTAGDGSLFRSGVFVQSVRSIGAGRWRVRMGGQNASTTTNSIASLNTTLRIFGRLDLNPGAVSGPPWGVKVWNAAGSVVFDSRAPMFRLAGNTYDTEVALSALSPSWNGGGDFESEKALYDSYITTPFSLANKSICAGTRGYVTGTNFIGSYNDVDNQTIYQHLAVTFGQGYWATGSTLVARKLVITTDIIEATSVLQPNYAAGLQTVYTRLAVIDNNQFP